MIKKFVFGMKSIEVAQCDYQTKSYSSALRFPLILVGHFEVLNKWVFKILVKGGK